RPPGFSPFA
nr:Chain B, Bradykinin [synthetic construct]